MRPDLVGSLLNVRGVEPTPFVVARREKVLAHGEAFREIILALALPVGVVSFLMQ